MRMALLMLFCVLISCKKFNQNTCSYGECDSRRYTKLVAQNWAGSMLYNNEINKWGISSIITGNPQGMRIAFVCGPLNDSFKVIGRQVFYSGYLKESCGNPRPSSIDQEIYYVQPTIIR
jgi:hypothetical protein